ncbi:MAG: hypothetical protein NWS07_01995, partial [Desulfobacterales bacterium]|nr:hypothetical protein [Desulfobacterales bacterium]
TGTIHRYPLAFSFLAPKNRPHEAAKPTVSRRLHAATKSQTGATISLLLAKDEGINVDVTY